VDKFPEVRFPRYVPPQEHFEKVLAHAQGQDRVMLMAILYLAARKNEIFRLQWKDVDFVNNRARLWTRKREGGNLEPDWVPLAGELKSQFLWWWEHRPTAIG
jgi:integrase